MARVYPSVSLKTNPHFSLSEPHIQKITLGTSKDISLLFIPKISQFNQKKPTLTLESEK